jgi:uncharacterized protein (DUF362 family)
VVDGLPVGFDLAVAGHDWLAVDVLAVEILLHHEQPFRPPIAFQTLRTGWRVEWTREAHSSARG